LNLALERQYKRWYELKDHPVQLALVKAISNGIRFPVVPAGRRSGKTERFKRFIAKEAMKNEDEKYFIAAPTRDQVKKIYWDDMKALTFSSMHKKRPSESDLIVFMPNGSEIHLIGLDRPERIEGIPWTGGGIDEIADIKEHAWEAHILPALNTVNPTRPDYRAWCWLLGVPDGLNHYYDMARYAERGEDSDWALFHWKSAEILPPDVIESARRQMSAKQFRQEFEASFETVEGRVYPDYDRDLNHTPITIKDIDERLGKKSAIHIGMDFNINKMSAVIHAIIDGIPHAVDELMGLRDTPAMIAAINRKFDGRKILVYPDASGDSGDTRSSGETDHSLLRDAGFVVVADDANPRIRNRVNSVNAMICNAAGERRYLINNEMCPYTVDALERQLWGKDGKPDKEHDKDHPVDALGYFIWQRYPITGVSTSVQNMRAA
jgi:hypothetical protein